MTPKYSVECTPQPPLTCIIPFTNIQQLFSFDNNFFHQMGLAPHF